jgi:GT2 family glycosyltransferase
VTATVVIVTKNRKDDLLVAVRSAVSQTARPEVMVIDDGSTDGTESALREYPGVRFVREGGSRGYIVRRNEAARLATGDVVFSIDDDAAFVSARTVEQTLREFDTPRIGAVAIPYVEPRKGVHQFQTSPGGPQPWITDAFIGTAHAVRRDVFLKVGGYQEALVHQGEEEDFCLRMLAAGYVVRLGGADPIHHYESPRRDFTRMDYYGRRNAILFAWHLVPFTVLPVHLAGVTINGIRTALRLRRGSAMWRGTIDGYLLASAALKRRSAVSWRTYRLHRELRKRGPLDLTLAEARLPSLAT